MYHEAFGIYLAEFNCSINHKEDNVLSFLFLEPALKKKLEVQRYFLVIHYFQYLGIPEIRTCKWRSTELPAVDAVTNGYALRIAFDLSETVVIASV